MVNDVTVVSPSAVANELRPVILRLARELRKETEQLGVTGRQATLLGVVQQNPGLTLRALAQEEGISAPALSGYVDRLERLRLLERTRSDIDKRRVGITITPEGERLLRRIRERRTTWLIERLSRLDPDELATVAAAVAPLLRVTEERQ
jgi:DNA-binding MarR family transcriptional regulator